MKKLLFTLAIASLFLFSACTENQPQSDFTEVAKCLTSKGVVMYGAEWCPHCQAQKKAFGKAIEFIKYQECDDSYAGGDHAKCIEMGVTSYPTWIIPGIDVLVGEVAIPDLAKTAGCADKLPAELQVAAESTSSTDSTSPVAEPSA